MEIMKPNAVILTSGLTGSSVLSALISRAGYWTGDSTLQKEAYDTYENEELIKLNLRLFKEAGYAGDYLIEFSQEAIRRIGDLYGKIDSRPYESFLEKCGRHAPWIWKDPRLWLTIRFWKNLLNRESCRFILLTRSTVQLWISSTLRGQIRTYRHATAYERRIIHSITDFFEENDLRYLSVEYERLIRYPTDTIDNLNALLHAGLTVEDLERVYHKPLYKNPRNSLSNHVKALLMYAKNYSERLDIESKSIIENRARPENPDRLVPQ